MQTLLLYLKYLELDQIKITHNKKLLNKNWDINIPLKEYLQQILFLEKFQRTNIYHCHLR